MTKIIERSIMRAVYKGHCKYTINLPSEWVNGVDRLVYEITPMGILVTRPADKYDPKSYKVYWRSNGESDKKYAKISVPSIWVKGAIRCRIKFSSPGRLFIQLIGGCNE